MRHSRCKRVLAVLVVLSIATPSWLLAAVSTMPQLPNPGSVMGVTRQEQQQLGQQAVAEVYKQMPILPDSSPVTQYVQQLGRRLAATIPQQYSWPYQFHVVQQKEINAFALPGGPVFVNVGTITAADNEAELVGVIAHEMAHVYMQHSIKQAEKASLAQGILGVLGGIVGGGVWGNLARAGISIGAGTVFMKYSRDDEAQADAVGAILMYRSGYNPIDMANFFKKLEEQRDSGPPQFLSSHPNPGNRYKAVSNQVSNWPPQNFLSNSAQFRQARQEALNVQAYTAQEVAQMAKNGQIRNAPPGGGQTKGPSSASVSQVMPSGSYRRFDHSAFSIQYPDNWDVMGDRYSGVTIAPEAGITQNAVAYGAVLNKVGSRNDSFDAQVQQLLASLQQSDPNLRVTGTPQPIRVNGVRGRSVDLVGTSPIAGKNGQPERERDWFVALPSAQGGLVYVVFVSPEPTYSRLRPTFERMLRSLRLK